MAKVKHKASWIGAPAVFALELACLHLHDAFPSYGIYLVGSAIDDPEWRDVDLRMIMADEEFNKLFPAAQYEKGVGARWESDPRWLVMTVAISQWLTQQSGLPVDFQFQPQTHANDRHKGQRSAVGMRIAPKDTP